MNFGKVIKALKQGKKVTRDGWNENTFLYLDENKSIVLKTTNGMIENWSPTNDDMLSNVWHIVGECEKQRPIEQPLEECRMGEEMEAIVRGIEKWAEADKENRPYLFIGYDKKQSQVVYLRGGSKTILSFALYESMKKDESLKSFLLTTLVSEKIMSTMFK